VSECREVAETLLPRFLQENPGVKLYVKVEAFVNHLMADESYTVKDNVTYHLHRLVVVAVDSNPEYDEPRTYAERAPK
jgi:hypothetical protein